MKKFHLVSILSVLLLIILFVVPLFAEETANNKLEFKAKLWTKFTYDATENSVHSRGFDIDRAYLQMGYKFDDTWSALLLLDGVRGETITVTAGTGDETTVSGRISRANFFSYVRNIYVQASDIFPEKGTFRFGFQPTLYISTVDGATKTRWLGKSLADQTSALLSQSGGAAITGMALQSHIKYGVMVHNGTEGLTSAPSDNGLATDGIITLMPFAHTDGALKKFGLTVAEEAQFKSKRDKTSTGVTTRGYYVTSAAAHYESPMIDTAAEFIYRTAKGDAEAGVGYGLTANIKFNQEKASLYGRFFTGNDFFKTNQLAAKHIVTVGPSYAFIKDKVSTALLYENRKALTNATMSTNTVMWNWAVNF
jgi:hypothetical protein